MSFPPFNPKGATDISDMAFWNNYKPEVFIHNELSTQELEKQLNTTPNQPRTIQIKPGVISINGIEFISNGGTISLIGLLQPSSGGKKKTVRKTPVKKTKSS